ncbi:mechanosensitive ion channel [Natronomonas sp. CBA1123]|uniref:mechanosensitive ion channel family protein n=1 Tax=Natronomonas sp. CBA1123 TaxID=2668070 RepID=UPI0012EA860A|nr:mechanosensitive ion channel domain-containing protein [Natronomonas sp. CBA1123]MUV85779.1 mechanosensitive ion channel [Natronomonas sp. CBA1123]
MIPLQSDASATAAPEQLANVIGIATIFDAVLVFAAAYVFARILTFLLSATAERSPNRRITIKMFIPVVRLLVYVLAVYVVVVPLLELNSTQLLAASGLFGAALGFGLRDVVAGLFGGLFIVFEKPFQVGDKVSIGDDYGEVTRIGLRSTTLRTPDDTAVVVPNDRLFTDNVGNANAGSPHMMVVTELSVAPSADIDRAKAIVEEAIVTSPYVYVDDDYPVTVLVNDETYYRRIRGKAYVDDLRDEFPFASDVTERSLEAFAERGIETPELPPPDYRLTTTTNASS